MRMEHSRPDIRRSPDSRSGIPLPSPPRGSAGCLSSPLPLRETSPMSDERKDDDYRVGHFVVVNYQSRQRNVRAARDT